MTLHRLEAELWRLATLTTKNGGKLKIMTGPHSSSSQALNKASISSYSIESYIADLSDPHLGPQVDGKLQAEADEAILNGIVSGGSSQSSRQASQQAPLKIITRPVSSGKDPAAGFSFTKAKPMQQLDFRRPKQNSTILPPQDLHPPSMGMPTEAYSHQSSPLPNTAQAVQNIALASGHSPAEIVKAVDQPQASLQNRSRKPSREPLTSVAGAPKITKSRRKKTKMGPATDGPPAPLNLKDAYTEDDLLRLLMYRWRQGQQELECFRATQHQKETEIQKLRDISNNLYSQLQEVEQRETQKNAELSKIKANKPIWESKIKRLNDYVKGLTNDHNRLRDDADDLHKRHKDVFVARKELHNTLEDAQKSAEQERIRSQRLEDDARYRIETLAQTVQHQNIQLLSDENLLMAERERSNRLEDQISRITASHGQLLELFTGHRDTITGKIDDLLQQAQSIVPPTKASESDSQNPIRSMLEQCVGLLQELHKVDAVKPEDLRKLNDSMDSFIQGIARSVEACEESSNSMEAGQKQLALAVQDQLRALNGNIFSEHALSEQISDLREVRATIRERLQATESSLADARQEVAALRLKDQEQSRKIVSLETVAARAQSQPAEAPQTLLRIQELDSRNRDLQSEIVILRKEAADSSSQLKQSSTDAREVTERLATTQKQLEAAHGETARSLEEKSTSERQAIFEREQLRKELSKAANMQLASMQSEHMNVIQQLKLEKSPAEEKLKNVIRQVNMLKAEKEKSEKETAQLQALLKGAQSEKEAVIGTRKALQLHLKEMETRMHEKNNEYGDVQAMLNKANDQVKAKDLEIVALQASQATKPSSSRVIEQSPSVRGTQSIRNRHALHRDTQHASINQSPSVQPTNPKSSRHFTNRPPIVEDSQPTGKPPFVSLEDLMLDDPFAGYAQEGPQTIAGEDISHLFPSTPGAISRSKDIDYSRNSVFHTTVVSETQRRQHQSLREATPHIGTHTTNKSHSQSQARTYSKAGNNCAMPRSSTGTSPTNITARRRDTNMPSLNREASITRESTQPQRSVKDPRQGKRNTVAAGFNEINSQARPSKMQKAEPLKKALGPIIEDSQSPLLNGRSRKMTRRKSSAPKGEVPYQSFWAMLKELTLDDKFTRRFAQA